MVSTVCTSVLSGVCVGIRESAVNRAEGLRQSKILASEAVRIEQVNQAKGEASAILARATARAHALLTLGKAIGAKVSYLRLSLSLSSMSGDCLLYSMDPMQHLWLWLNSMSRHLGSWQRPATLSCSQRRQGMLALW